MQDILLSYQPRASVVPAALDLTDNPFMWPFHKQPLYAGAMPTMFNATVLNGMSLTGDSRLSKPEARVARVTNRTPVLVHDSSSGGVLSVLLVVQCPFMKQLFYTAVHANRKWGRYQGVPSSGRRGDHAGKLFGL